MFGYGAGLFLGCIVAKELSSQGLDCVARGLGFQMYADGQNRVSTARYKPLWRFYSMSRRIFVRQQYFDLAPPALAESHIKLQTLNPNA